MSGVQAASTTGHAAVVTELNRAQDTRQPVALLVVGLTGLDEVRAVAGRRASREAGSELVLRLTTLATDEGTAVALDPGQLALVLPGADREKAVDVAEQALQLVGQPTTTTPPFRLAADVGATVLDDPAFHSEAALQEADTALAVAATRGPGAVEVHSPGLRDRMAAGMRTAVDLGRALASGEELFLHYQPVVDLATGSVVGAEALARWRHPEHGLISPGEFIPVAERTGLIAELGRWVLDAATAQLAEWQPVTGDHFRLHVNLSAVELRQPRLVDQVVAALNRHHVAPDRLLLEITETALVSEDWSDMGSEDSDPVARLTSLRNTGVSLGIDDFGTGYSSIGYLRELPVDMVKLDRSLTSLVASSPDEYALTRAIFGLMRSSGLEVVAEGIEEHVQLAHLRAMRCRYGQGFLLARPTDADRVTSLLQR